VIPILFPDRLLREREKSNAYEFRVYPNETLKQFVAAEKPSRDEKQRITNSLHSLIKEKTIQTNFNSFS